MPNTERYVVPNAVGLAKGKADDRQATILLQDFLKRFGYLNSDTQEAAIFAAARDTSLPQAERGDFDEATEAALYQFQEFHGLSVTGVLDKATIEEMGKRRCGCPDQPSHTGLGQFVAQGNRWNTNNLTYRIVNFSADLGQEAIRTAMRQALDLWASVTPLTFTEVSGNADILISFHAGDHGDGSPFDGVGNVLAHAFFPPPNGGDIAGDAHFDEAETWTVDIPIPGGATDLVTVAAHEFGHSLGLNHSSVPGALMFPTYSGAHRFLHQDDIAGIQSIYGGLSLAQAMWTHGHSIEIEYPERLARIWKPGFYAELEGQPNSTNWFHFAIPTKVIVDDVRLRTGSVMLLVETLSNAALIRDVHIYDGDRRIATHNGVNLSGNVGFVRFDVPNNPSVLWGIGVSVGVSFGDEANSRVMRFKSAGCDFLA